MDKLSYWMGIPVLVFILFVPMSASAMGIEAAVGIWNQKPSGDIGSMGDSLSVENDLKYGSQNKVFGRIKVDMPLVIPNIYLMATPVRFDGDGVKSSSFKFGDNVFAGNVPFSSSLKMDHYDIALYYGLPFLKTATFGMFNLEVGLNGRIFDLKAEINQPTTGNQWVTLTLPIPMLYLGAQLKPVKYLSLEAEARGVGYGSTQNYDLIGRLKVSPYGPLFLAGGYRYEKIKIDQNDIKVNITLEGPFLELGFVF